MRFRVCLPLLAVTLLALLPPAAKAQGADALHPDKSGQVALTLGAATKSVAGWGTPNDDASIEGNPLKIGSVAFPRGIGTHAPGELDYAPNGGFRWLSFFAGIDAENNAGTVTVQVWLDGKQVYETPVLRAGQPPLFVCVPVGGTKELKIAFTDAGDGLGGDHLDLAQLALSTQEIKPMPVLPQPDTLTPVADTAALMPRHGTVSIQPAKQWDDGLAAGNGIMGALLYGGPRHDTLIANHCKLWLPAGSREILPDMGDVLPEMRKIIGEQGYDAGQKFFLDTARKQGWGGSLVWTDAFHPGFFLNIDQPGDGPITNYARVENFATGEVWTQWHTDAGDFQRRLFVSKPDNVIVVTTIGPPGKVSCRVTMQHVANDLIQSEVVHAQGMIACHNVYVKGKGGYDGAVRVIAAGGTQTSDGKSVSVADANSVTLILRIQPWKTPLTDGSQAWPYSPQNPDFARADQTAGLYRAAKAYDPRWMEELKGSLQALSPNYAALLKPHAAAWGKLFDRVTLDLGGTPEERGMSSEAILDKAQHEQRLSPALLERMYDAGRYVFMCSAGPQTPPNLFGIWTGDVASRVVGRLHHRHQFAVGCGMRLQRQSGRVHGRLFQLVGQLHSRLSKERARPVWVPGHSGRQPRFQQWFGAALGRRLARQPLDARRSLDRALVLRLLPVHRRQGVPARPRHPVHGAVRALLRRLPQRHGRRKRPLYVPPLVQRRKRLGR